MAMEDIISVVYSRDFQPFFFQDALGRSRENPAENPFLGFSDFFSAHHMVQPYEVQILITWDMLIKQNNLR